MIVVNLWLVRKHYKINVFETFAYSLHLRNQQDVLSMMCSAGCLYLNNFLIPQKICISLKSKPIENNALLCTHILKFVLNTGIYYYYCLLHYIHHTQSARGKQVIAGASIPEVTRVTRPHKIDLGGTYMALFPLNQRRLNIKFTATGLILITLNVYDNPNFISKYKIDCLT